MLLGYRLWLTVMGKSWKGRKLRLGPLYSIYTLYYFGSRSLLYRTRKGRSCGVLDMCVSCKNEIVLWGHCVCTGILGFSKLGFPFFSSGSLTTLYVQYL